MVKLSLLAAVCLFASGCKKKDEAKPATTISITTGDQYAARATALMTGMGTIFEADGKDCDKLATNVGKYLDDNKATIEAADAFEKANPDVIKGLDAKMAPVQESLGKKMMPSLEACKEHKGLEAALAKLD